jgi:hypothetical protein
MEQDQVLVPGEVDIALHPVGPVSQCLQVGGPGVFGVCAAGTTMGKDQRPLRH